MGACASRPKDLDTEEVPAPVEAPAPTNVEAPAATEKVEAEIVSQESKDGDEKEKFVIDQSEPALEAPKNDEVAEIEPKPATEEVVPAEVKPTETKVEAVQELPKEENKIVA